MRIIRLVALAVLLISVPWAAQAQGKPAGKHRGLDVGEIYVTLEYPLAAGDGWVGQSPRQDVEPNILEPGGICTLGRKPYSLQERRGGVTLAVSPFRACGKERG